MTALITGSRGFVGGYLRAELEANGYDVIGLNSTKSEGAVQADILDAEQLKSKIFELRPKTVFHLAGQANVAGSWEIPARTFEINVIGTINLLEAVRAFDPSVRMVIIGSSDQYGSLGEHGDGVSETMPMHPQNPYSVSKKAQEEIAGVYARARGMNICLTRSFNHGGPGQKRGYLISDFASGIVDVENGRAEKLLVGNLSARRDFTHVRDVARAYRLIAEQGRSGEVYNVGSGISYSAKEILDKLINLAKCEIPVEQDPGKLRPSDTPVIRCDRTKLTQDTGWQPEIPIDELLRETLEYWRNS